MKSFFKNVLANIVAIMLLCFVFFFFFILMIVIGSSGEGEVKVKSNSILTINDKLMIIDGPTENAGGLFDFESSNSKVKILDIIDAIEAAKSDDKIKGISIESDVLNAGATQLDDLRDAIEDFKKSGKFVYAYGNAVSQGSYIVGSVADKYFLNPTGMVDLKGLSTEVTMFKNFMDKYGIGMEVIRHGKYKAAVEPYLLNSISEENREQLTTLLNDIWKHSSSKIAKSRKIDFDNLMKITDSLDGMIPEKAVTGKLVDQLIQKSEYDQILKTQLKLSAKEKLNKVSLAKYSKSLTGKKQTGENVAVLYASGAIYSGDDYADIHSEKYIKYIQDLAKDDKIKAVVLRINSPGGSANASDEILFELQRLKEKKPLVVSFGDYAASGGYYIAMAADRIYSEPNTLTGSIGVFGTVPNAKELASRNGINADVIQTNANSQYHSVFHGLSSHSLAMLTRSVEDTYNRFVGFVMKNRKKSFEDVDAIGGGRVWSGTRAKKIGLVDELGGLKEAVAFAAKKAKVSNFKVATYPKEKTEFEQIMESFEEDDLSIKLLESKLGKENYRMINQLIDDKKSTELQMVLPFGLKVN